MSTEFGPCLDVNSLSSLSLAFCFWQSCLPLSPPSTTSSSHHQPLASGVGQLPAPGTSAHSTPTSRWHNNRVSIPPLSHGRGRSPPPSIMVPLLLARIIPLSLSPPIIIRSLEPRSQYISTITPKIRTPLMSANTPLPLNHIYRPPIKITSLRSNRQRHPRNIETATALTRPRRVLTGKGTIRPQARRCTGHRRLLAPLNINTSNRRLQIL